MMRILHGSDSHLGYNQYGNPERKQDFIRSFEQFGQIARGEHPDYDNEPVDAVLHTGDLFDDQRTSIGTVHACMRELNKLAEAEIPFYAIVGNHERLRDSDFLDIYEESGIATRLSSQPELLCDGEVALYGIDAVRPQAIETTDFSLEPTSGDTFNLVAMHQLFTPPMNDLPSTRPLGPVLDQFGIDVDAVALGDCHERQADRCDGVPVWYSGSMERTDVDEEQERSVELMTIDPESEPALTRERMVLDTRTFRSASISFGPDDGFQHVEQVVSELGEIEDAVVEIDLNGEQNTVTNQDVIGYLEGRGVLVSRVDDNRTGAGAIEDLPEPDERGKLGLDMKIDEAVAEQDFEAGTRDVDSMVRDPDISKSNVRDQTKELLTELEEETFDDDLADLPGGKTEVDS